MITFPKSRVCAIDAYPFLEQGIKTALSFAKKHNISLLSPDGKNLITTFSLRQIEEGFDKTTTPYNKVLFISSKKAPKKILNFIENYFDRILQNQNIPYCGKYEPTSPDLEPAAQKTAERSPASRRIKFEAVLRSLKLRNVQQ